MRRSHKRFLVALFSGIGFSLQGCASLNQRTALPEVPRENPTVSYAVQPGDNLSEIALNLTGDASNWGAIAAHNSITDPYLLEVGETLLIPQSLVESASETLMPEDPDAESVPTSHSDENLKQHSIALATAATLPRADAAHLGSALAMKSIADPFSGSPEDVALFPVSVNRRFTLIPVDLQTLYSRSGNEADQPATVIRSVQGLKEQSAPAVPSDPPLAPYVKIVGTYYPKVIYAGPGNYTDMVMRVLPGTVFELDSEVNDWYKVKTEKGTGFVRASDAIPVHDAASL